MTLPGIDLSGVVDAINANTVQLKRVADALTDNNDAKVKRVVDRLEAQYRAQIDDLTARLPHNGNTFNIPGSVSGGLGAPPASDVEPV